MILLIPFGDVFVRPRPSSSFGSRNLCQNRFRWPAETRTKTNENCVSTTDRRRTVSAAAAGTTCCAPGWQAVGHVSSYRCNNDSRRPIRVRDKAAAPSQSSRPKISFLQYTPFRYVIYSRQYRSFCVPVHLHGRTRPSAVARVPRTWDFRQIHPRTSLTETAHGNNRRRV